MRSPNSKLTPKRLPPRWHPKENPRVFGASAWMLCRFERDTPSMCEQTCGRPAGKPFGSLRGGLCMRSWDAGIAHVHAAAGALGAGTQASLKSTRHAAPFVGCESRLMFWVVTARQSLPRFHSWREVNTPFPSPGDIEQGGSLTPGHKPSEGGSMCS